MPVLDEIAARLVEKGVGVVGTSIFKGSNAPIPSGAGPYLSLVETGGSGSARTHTDTATERPTVQLMVRAKDDINNARAMLKAAYDALGGANGLYNIELSGVFYLSITARQGITDTGKDAAGRPTLAFNIDAEKQPS